MLHCKGAIQVLSDDLILYVAWSENSYSSECRHIPEMG